MIKKFTNREEIDKKILYNWLNDLKPIEPNILKKEGIFTKKEYVFDNKEALFEMLDGDLAYEEHIALEVYKIFKGILINNYYWEFELVKAKAKDHLMINLVFESMKENRGRVLFPIAICKSLNRQFYYWEVLLDKDTAINSLELFK